MTDYARRERRDLADLFLATGPDAPTLCAGWTTRDLAAHLVMRERRPDASLAVLVRPLAGHAERVRQELAARPYEEVVAAVRRPPWWSPISNPLTDETLNGLEYFIHHEDVRRAVPDWTPRPLEARQQAAIWRAVRLATRFGLRRLNVPVVVRAPGLGEVRTGKEEPLATLTGDPGELALFLSGRQRAAAVEVDGAPEAATRLRTARLGI